MDTHQLDGNTSSRPMRAWVALACGLILCASIGSCRKNETADNAPHPRIVSFSPALTEMLFDMGLGDHVVGVTTSCVLPEGVSRPRVCNMMNAEAVEPILSVKPDCVVAQISPSKLEALQRIAPEIKIEHFDIETLADISAAITHLGQVVGRPEVVQPARQKFEQQLDEVRRAVADKPRPRVLFMAPKSLAAGTGTFLDEMIQVAGGTNAATFKGWQNINLDAVMAARPDVLICQADPDEDAAKTKAYWEAVGEFPAAKSHRVLVVSDRHWTIPTARSAQYVRILAEMLHPGALAGKAP